MRNILFATLAVPLLAAIPSQAEAKPCKSVWSDLGDAFNEFGPVVARAICNYTNSDSEAAAQQCVDDYEAAVAQIEQVVKTYNVNAKGGKIGPRGLGESRWYTGKLLAERTFIAPPAMHDRYRFEFEGTGGKGKKPFDVQVCWVDAQGNEVVPSKTRRFTTNDGKWTEQYSGVAGARAMVYLKNKTFVTTNAHRYRIKLTPTSGEPDGVRRARRRLASTGSTGSTGKPGSKPAPKSRPKSKPKSKPKSPTGKGRTTKGSKKGPTSPNTKKSKKNKGKNKNKNKNKGKHKR